MSDTGAPPAPVVNRSTGHKPGAPETNKVAYGRKGTREMATSREMDWLARSMSTDPTGRSARMAIAAMSRKDHRKAQIMRSDYAAMEAAQDKWRETGEWNPPPDSTL